MADVVPSLISTKGQGGERTEYVELAVLPSYDGGVATTEPQHDQLTLEATHISAKNGDREPTKDCSQEKEQKLNGLDIRGKNAQFHQRQEPDLVDWDGLEDPKNPINWPESFKWINVAIISAITFITFGPHLAWAFGPQLTIADH